MSIREYLVRHAKTTRCDGERDRQLLEARRARIAAGIIKILLFPPLPSLRSLG